MSITYLIDHIRSITQERNVATPLRRGRGLVAQVLFGKSYEQAVAAERAGKLDEPTLDAVRTGQLRKTYQTDVDVVVEVAELVLPYWPAQQIMTGNQAVKTGLLPAYAPLTLALLEQLDKKASSKGMELEWITLNPGNIRQGKHLRFVRTGGAWYALEDMHLKDGTTCVTAEFNGTVFRYRDKDDEEGTHHFLAHIYESGKWQLRPSAHSLADEDQFDLTWAELSFV
jgi:hypothetical protein